MTRYPTCEMQSMTMTSSLRRKGTLLKSLKIRKRRSVRRPDIESADGINDMITTMASKLFQLSAM